MGKLKIKLGYQPQAIELQTLFIDYYFIGCPPVYVLIYIYTLRHLLDGQIISISDLSKHFDITESDVLAAWNYWNDIGLVTLQEADDLSITFLPVREPVKKLENREAPKIAHIETRPQYTTQELALYKSQSKDIANLFLTAEQTLGKMLTYNDMNTIFSFHDWLRLPIDVIEYLFCYCMENDHRSLRYIEKCAIDWSENAIDDLEKALLYVQAFDKNYRSVLKHLGKFSSYPSPSEKKYIDKWLNEWGFSIDLIIHACDKTSVSTIKPSVKYVDKIISDWYKNGYKSIEEIEKADARFISEKTSDKKPKTNRFANFKQRDNDYSDMEEEYIQRVIEEMEHRQRLEAV